MLNLFASVFFDALASWAIMGLIIASNGFNELVVLAALSILGSLMWIPCNYCFFNASSKDSVPLTKLYTGFGVGTAVLATFLGIVVYKELPNNTTFMVLGLGFGIVSIISGAKNKERLPKIPPPLAFTAIGFSLALTLIGCFYLKSWVLGIIAFGLADFFGIFCADSIEAFLKSKGSIWASVLGSTLGFSPAVVAIVILLLRTQTLSFAGPAASIASVVTATLGSLILSRSWKNQIIPATLGCLAIWMLHQASL